MSRHPLKERFAECFVDSSLSPDELHHIRECPQCAKELQQFESMLALLRDSVRMEADQRLNQLEVPALAARRLEHSPGLRWKWALAAAVVFSMGFLPLIFQSRRLEVSPTANSDVEAAALMESINIHVSRDLPAFMEPLMLVVPYNNPKQ